MKVVWIVPGFSSSEQDWCIPALLDLARALARRCRLSVVSMRYPYRRDDYNVSGIQVCSVGGGHRGPAYTCGIWRATARAVREIHGDVVHAFWAYEPGLIAAGFRRQMPVVISLAGGELASLPEIGYGLMRKTRTRLAVLWALRRAHAVTAGSPSLIERACELVHLQTLNHLPLGVDLGRWPWKEPRLVPPVILNVGSLEPVKGQALLLRAFARVVRRIPQARLRIAGGGRGLEALEKLRQELNLTGSVEFMGAVLHERLPDCHAESSMFVQSSWHEAQGMALLEAAASGLPAAGTQVGALANLSAASPYRVPQGNDHMLADAILRMLDSPDEAVHVSRRVREQVEAVYSLDTAADRFLSLYESLL